MDITKLSDEDLEELTKSIKEEQRKRKDDSIYKGETIRIDYNPSYKEAGIALRIKRFRANTPKPMWSMVVRLDSTEPTAEEYMKKIIKELGEALSSLEERNAGVAKAKGIT